MLGVVVSGVIGCLPVSDFGGGSSTTGTTGSGQGMSATSNVGVTGTGGVTSEGTGSTSSGSSTGSLPTTAEPTCGGLDCGADLPVECDVLAQECPEGQKCMPIITDGGGAWDSSRCVPVLGMGAPGDACTAESLADGLDDCAEGAMCWGVDMEGNGDCVALCGGTWDALTCPDDGFCTIAAGGGSLAICLPQCDPLLQDCDEGDACYPIDDGFTCAPDASGDVGEANDPCEFINVCEAGLLCGDPAFVGAGCAQGSLGCCTPFCGFPGGACPNLDQACVQWFDPAMLPEGDPRLAIGACGVPS